MKTIEIIGGGTVSHVRNHLALTAPAYGNTARRLKELFYNNNFQSSNYEVNLHLTKMANSGNSELETNQDISNLVDKLIENKDTKIIIFNPALVDFDGNIQEWLCPTDSGKYATRLKTSEGNKTLLLKPSDKIIGKIRKVRKDIFLVGFKTTCGASEDEQFLSGLNLLKQNSCNLVLANDTKTRVNMIITPEQARYSVSTNRDKVLSDLLFMAVNRAKGIFTRSTIIKSDPVNWNDEKVHPHLRDVVNFCIKKGAYKPFNGSTVGHFAIKLNENQFLTSRRKTNFNNLNEVGLVAIDSYDDNTVIAYGSSPSVGAQSQRIIFKEHADSEFIVHFHCPPKKDSSLSVRSQTLVECGSHQCGQNTSDGLRETYVPGLKCVYLDKHGPNLVFNKETDHNLVIKFIEDNFDLSSSTDEVNRNIL
jgi:hypothetical protein